MSPGPSLGWPRMGPWPSLGWPIMGPWPSILWPKIGPRQIHGMIAMMSAKLCALNAEVHMPRLWLGIGWMETIVAWVLTKYAAVGCSTYMASLSLSISISLCRSLSLSISLYLSLSISFFLSLIFVGRPMNNSGQICIKRASTSSLMAWHKASFNKLANGFS